MLKDILKPRRKQNASDKMPLKLKGRLTIKAERNGEVIHYDEGDNVVTVWAKHATMHLLSSESFSSHGNVNDSGTMVYSSRSITPADHALLTDNVDGTLISEEQYLGDNTQYYGTSHKYLSKADNLDVADPTDDSTNFDYSFFPTKMLFGTGVEYSSWADVTSDGKDGDASDITSYQHVKNGGWNQTSFETLLSTDPTNYYSNIWDGSELTPARTVNDVYSGVSAGTDPTETDFGIPGAIKDCTFRGGSTETTNKLLADANGNLFAKDSYRGIGRPSFVYATRGRFMDEDSEVKLSVGSSAGTENLESKITFTVVLPEQEDGEFYPYNGYTLKLAGLFCDARMLLGNSIPDGSAGDEHADEEDNYKKMPAGIMFAKRKISPIFKSADIRITASWSVYLP